MGPSCRADDAVLASSPARAALQRHGVRLAARPPPVSYLPPAGGVPPLLMLDSGEMSRSDVVAVAKKIVAKHGPYFNRGATRFPPRTSSGHPLVDTSICADNGMSQFLDQLDTKSVADVWRQRALEVEEHLDAACRAAMRVGVTLPDDSPLKEEWET
jgi:hypothetical protein